VDISLQAQHIKIEVLEDDIGLLKSVVVAMQI
jgi:hypothetical protein